MNIVTFPCFNLKFELNKIAFSLFGINIYWYAIFIVSSIIIALLLCKKDSGKYNVTFETMLDLAIYLIPISIISARIYYVLFDFNNYLLTPLEIFNFRNGGLAIYGGIIGGAITTIIFCKKRKISILDVLDYLAPFLPLAQSLGRWGNFVNVEAYGTTTNLPWRMGIFENSIYKEVHPTFLYESIGTLSIFLILYLIRNKRKFKGQIVYLYLIMYSFVRFFVESLRIDSLMFFNVRISQVLSLSIFVVFCVIFVKKHIKSKKK